MEMVGKSGNEVGRAKFESRSRQLSTICRSAAFVVLSRTWSRSVGYRPRGEDRFVALKERD